MSKSGSLAIAHGVAWLRVAGGNSVLPPWVHRTFTETSRLIHELREIPCDEPSCGYCRENHHAETLLARDFDKASFRPLLLTAPERRQVLDRIALGDAGIVLVSPEQFRNKTLADTRRGREIAAWVFDEAHCLSKWGHNFRTDYLYVTLETDRCPIRHNLMIPKRTVTNCSPISSHKTALSWMV